MRVKERFKPGTTPRTQRPRVISGKSLVLLFTAALATTISAVQALRLVTFGDSLTDSGNIYNLTNQVAPWPGSGYFPGSFSDGPSWNLLASKSLNASLWDFAHGSATTNNSLVKADNVPLTNRTSPDVFEQVVMYRNRLINSSSSVDETVHALWIGANNHFRTYADGILPSESDIEAWVDSTLSNAKAIVSTAETFNSTFAGRVRLVVFSMYPLEHAPSMHSYLPSSTNYLKIAALVQLHNSLLRSKLTSIQAETSFLDVYSLLLSPSSNFNQSTLEQPCIRSDSCKSGSKQGWLWWDEWHLMAHANEVIADAFVGLFEVQTVPTTTVPALAIVTRTSSTFSGAGKKVVGSLISWTLAALLIFLL